MNIKVNLTVLFLYDHKMLQTILCTLYNISNKRNNLTFKDHYKKISQPHLESQKMFNNVFCQKILSNCYLTNPCAISSGFYNILFLRLFDLLNLKTIKSPLILHLNVKPKSRNQKWGGGGTPPPSTKT